MDGPDCDERHTGESDAFRGRIADLENRVAHLEATLAARSAAIPVAPPPAPPAPPVRLAAPAPAPAPAPAWPTSATGAAPAPAASWTPVPAAPAGWGPPTSPAPTSPASVPRLTLRELEERFAGRLLAWTGAVALVAAAIFFVSLAFSRGWIGEEGRVAIGMAAGIAAFAGGAWFLVRKNPLMGRVLVAIGLGVFTVAVMAATRLYDLMPPEAGLLAALAASAAAAVLAIRTDSREIAAFGLVSGLLAPPLVGATPNTLTLAFVAIILVGTTTIALFRSWPWLPLIAFLLAAPQLASWLRGEDGAAPQLIALAAFWLLNVVAAAGEEVRVRRNDLRPSSAVLLTANAAFLAWGIVVVLDGSLEPWRGVACLVAATLHLLIGAWFLARQGLDHRFGNLVVATGATFLAFTAVVQLGAAVVPAAWAVEAVVLTWIAMRLSSRYIAWMALAFGVLAVAHLVSFAYPFWSPERIAGTPFLHPQAVSLVTVVASLLGAAWLLPARSVRSTFAGVALLLAAWAGPFELEGSVLVAWLVALVVGGVTLQVLIDNLPENPPAFAPDFTLPVAAPAEWASAITWLGAAGVALTGPLNPEGIAAAGSGHLPFADDTALQGGLLVLGALAVAAITAAARVRIVSLVAALVTAAFVVPFEAGADWVVVAWCGLAVLAWLAGTREAMARGVFAGLACLLGLGAIIVTFALVVPPSHLWVHDFPRAVDALPPAWPAAIAAVTALLLGASRLAIPERSRTAAVIGAFAMVTYGVSIAVVAAFQQAVGGGIATEELAKQAQVALSIAWMTLGVAALVAGLVLRRPVARDAGLGLLALATAKVFVVDLAALDVAYRVLSLAALGLLLLASAWLFTRFRGPRTGEADQPGGPT